jgi:hypothetical protein
MTIGFADATFGAAKTAMAATRARTDAKAVNFRVIP